MQTRWTIITVLLFVALAVGYSMSGEYRRASLWGSDWVGTPVGTRVQILPKDIADTLRGGAFGGGIAKNIAPAENAEYMLEDLRAAMDSIPESVKKLVEDRLIGVYLVQGMNLNNGAHAAGMAFETINFFRQYYGTVILIDRDSTDERADEALAGLSFVPLEKYGYFSLEAQLAESGSNDRITTLRTVLLHELGHVIDTDRDIVPDSFSYGNRTTGCGFVCLSWKQRELHRYGGHLTSAMSHLNRGQYRPYVMGLPKTLEALKASNFPSLYATVLPEEDFADSFAMYVHTVMLGLPWELTFRVDGEIKTEIGSCFHEGRCPKKRDYFDALLADVGS
jgi:hypothetical protein